MTNTWKDVGHASMNYWTKDIIIDPNDPTQNTWYVCVFSGWGGAPNGLGGLYKTKDRGANWTKLTGTLFDRVTSITFNPKKLSQAYLTTETQGLWVNDDMSNDLPNWRLVTSYPFRQPERVFFNPYKLNEMWVSSFGNGMKVGEIETTGTIEFNSPQDKLVITPNPNNGKFSLEIPSSGNYAQLEIYDAMGKMIYSEKINSVFGTKQILLERTNLKSGLYSVMLYGKEEISCGKFMVN